MVKYFGVTMPHPAAYTQSGSKRGFNLFFSADSWRFVGSCWGWRI